MYQVECPECGTELSVPEAVAGRRGACPACGASFRVPDPPASSQIIDVHAEVIDGGREEQAQRPHVETMEEDPGEEPDATYTEADAEERPHGTAAQRYERPYESAGGAQGRNPFAGMPGYENVRVWTVNRRVGGPSCCLPGCLILILLIYLIVQGIGAIF